MTLIYRHLINVLFPIIIILIFLRVWFKKEDKNRFKEKLFISSFKITRNKDKKLIWFHAASIGEIKSIIPLIKKLNTNNNFEDVILSGYLTADYILNYKLFDTYNLSISARNITDKRYSEAYEYKAPGRSLNFMLNRSF